MALILPAAATRGRGVQVSQWRRNVATSTGEALSSCTTSAPASVIATASASVSASTTIFFSGTRCRRRSMIVENDAPPVNVRCWAHTSMVSDRPRRWGTAPPLRIALIDKARVPGRVLRVQAMTTSELTCSAASTMACAAAAMPPAVSSNVWVTFQPACSAACVGHPGSGIARSRAGTRGTSGRHRCSGKDRPRRK
jgi:hypothetical protein